MLRLLKDQKAGSFGGRDPPSTVAGIMFFGRNMVLLQQPLLAEPGTGRHPPPANPEQASANPEPFVVI